MFKKILFLLATASFLGISSNSAFAQFILSTVDAKTRIPSSGSISGSSKVNVAGEPNQKVSFQVAFTSSGGSFQVSTACITKLYNSSGESIDNQANTTYFRVQCEDVSVQPTGGYTSANYSKPLIQLLNPMDPNNPSLPIPVSPTSNGAMWLDVLIPEGTAEGVYDGWFNAYLSDDSKVSIPVSITVNSVTTPPEPVLYYEDNLTRIPISGAVSGDSRVIISGVPGETASFQVAFTSAKGAYKIPSAIITKLYTSSGAMIDNQTTVTYYRVQCEESQSIGNYTTAHYTKPLIPLGNPSDPNNPNLPIDVSTTLNGGMWIDINIPPTASAGDYEGWFIAYPLDLEQEALKVILTVTNSESVSTPSTLSGASARGTAGNSKPG